MICLYTITWYAFKTDWHNAKNLPRLQGNGKPWMKWINDITQAWKWNSLNKKKYHDNDNILKAVSYILLIDCWTRVY